MFIAIIGLGASGILALKNLIDNSTAEIVVFEKTNKIASKLKGSGNGRCNVSNLIINDNSYNDIDFIKKVEDIYPTKKLLKYFEDIGILTYSDEENRVYPISESSHAFFNALSVNTLSKAKVLLNTPVYKITKENNKYFINDYKTPFDYVICSSGSNANIVSNKQLYTYDYLNDLNLGFKDIKPGLIPLSVKEDVKMLFGLRAKVKCILERNGETLYSEDGEIIFKNNGIGGIVIMNISNIISRYYPNEEHTLKIDFFKDITYNELNDYINKHGSIGIVNPLLYKYLENFKQSQHAKILKNCYFTIYNNRPISEAQIACGGVLVDEIDLNFMSKKHKNLFIIGEALNIDGMCGGYNLDFAFKSALISTNYIMKK